jgi:uncharacterized protein (DUF1697 family)
MTYVALLRGINVGGNNQIGMKALKAGFERLGMTAVRTYIASGNVIFEDETTPAADLMSTFEDLIKHDFGLSIRVLVKDRQAMTSIVMALPPDWANDSAMRCDVIFLWPDLDRPELIEELPVKQGIDEVRYVPGAVLWRIDRPNVTRSGLGKVVGTPNYRSMTIRNCNTTRKLLELMDQQSL